MSYTSSLGVGNRVGLGKELDNYIMGYGVWK
jgi:hypothetical protein